MQDRLHKASEHLANRLANALANGLAPWPALAAGMVLLRLQEWLNASGPTTTLGPMLAAEAGALLRGLPLWCLLAWPLLWWPSGRARAWALGLLASLVLVAEAALVHYAAVAGVPLGADLMAYSLSEIRTTVAGARLPGAGLLATLAAGLALVWTSLWLQEKKNRLHLPRALAVALLGLGLASALALPRNWLPVTEGGPANRLAFFVGDVLDQRSGHALTNVQTAGDPDHPFARPETTPDTLGPLLQLQDERPDLLFIVVEGLGRSFSGPGARLGSFTPFLDELAARSLYWENFLATQGRTFAVLPSVFGSLPFGPHGSAPIVHDSLPRLLKDEGYALRYFSGSNLEFDQQGAYLASEGVQSFFSERDFPPAARRLTEWGYADGDLFEAVSQKATTAGPTLTIVQTMSMHSPFVVPDQAVYRRKVEARLEQLGIPASQRAAHLQHQDIYASILYTDEMLRQFFARMERSPRWRNTLVLITGDHRLPEIPMDTRLERYHVPLIVASPMVRQPQRIRAVSSHFDVAPSLLALLSQRYGLRTPATVAWMGTGLDVSTEFHNLHTLPLQQTKTELSDYIAGLDYFGHDRLYRLGEGLQPEPVQAPPVQEKLQAGLAAFRAAQARMAQTGRLVPEASARQRIAYADQPRSLTSHAQGGADTRPHGVAVHDTQARFGSDGTLQAQGVYTQHDARTSPVFVPLLVLTDAEGRQLAEASGKAERLEAGQSATFNLQLSASALPAGTYYASLIVSHPDTGKSIGQGQYHVAVRK